MRIDRGTLVLVVGPSGAGKDSVLNGARAALAGDSRFIFVQRTITREAGAGGEDNAEVTPEAFAAAKAAGAFALSWRAHGLCYGVPADILQDLAAGRRVVVNVSRGVIEEARRRLGAVRVVSVSADPEQLAERLRQRGVTCTQRATSSTLRAASYEPQATSHEFTSHKL